MAFMFEEEHDIETAKPRDFVGDEQSFTLWGALHWRESCGLYM